MLGERKLLLLIAYLVVVVGLLIEVRAYVVPVQPGCPGYGLICPPGCRKVGGEWQDACGNPSTNSCCEYLYRIAGCIKGTPPNEILCATGYDLVPQSIQYKTTDVMLIPKIVNQCKLRPVHLPYLPLPLPMSK